MAPSTPKASSPGFGYVILGQPFVAKFRQIGKYHTISNFPVAHALDPAGEVDITVCMWLGPGQCICQDISISI